RHHHGPARLRGAGHERRLRDGLPAGRGARRAMKAHRLVLVGLALAACGEGGGGRGADRPFVLDPFYTQSIDCGGIVVAGSSRVDPRTLERTCARIEEILEPLEAVRAYLVERHLLVAVWGYGEDATTLPEFSRYFWAMTGAASCSGAG